MPGTGPGSMQTLFQIPIQTLRWWLRFSFCTSVRADTFEPLQPESVFASTCSSTTDRRQQLSRILFGTFCSSPLRCPSLVSQLNLILVSEWKKKIQVSQLDENSSFPAAAQNSRSGWHQGKLSGALGGRGLARTPTSVFQGVGDLRQKEEEIVLCPPGPWECVW